jgi:hypothetical protein
MIPRISTRFMMRPIGCASGNHQIVDRRGLCSNSLPCAVAPARGRARSRCGHPGRSGTIHSGNPAALACASSTDRRIPCIATRSNSLLSVVSRPTMSQSPRWRRMWSVHALSLPLLHDTRTRFMQGHPNESQHTPPSSRAHTGRRAPAQNNPERFRVTQLEPPASKSSRRPRPPPGT